MTRLMYDSVNPNGIPSDATMVACYIDGRFANEAAMRRRFPHAQIVEIAVRASTDAGQVLDVERGDATPSEAVSWVMVRRRAGADPTIYTSYSEWRTVRKAFQDAGVREPHYWIALWDHTISIPTGAVAKQYSNHTEYDVSAVANYWPGVDKPQTKKPTPPPIVTHSRYVVKPGDTLSWIASHYGMSLGDLEKLNPQIHDPNVIHPGDVINLSGTVPVRVAGKYLVKTGDTLSEIAASHHTTVAHLLKVNPYIKDPDVIYAGSYIAL